MNSYHDFVRAIAEDLRNAKGLPLGEAASPEQAEPAADAPVAMMFSPHPDDECIMGGLPLRLARESGFRIINVPVTYGSGLHRRDARKRELADACGYLGFGIEPLSEDGFDRITAEGRASSKGNWEEASSRARGLLERFEPAAVVFPHARDGHPTHIGTGLLVADSLRGMSAGFECLAIETEYWHPMETPNLMVELDERTVGDLVTALSFHKGEVGRNPFHLTLPAWMIDNVRRGSEVVGGPGAEGRDYLFAALYRVSMFRNGELASAFADGRFASAAEPAAKLLFGDAD